MSSIQFIEYAISMILGAVIFLLGSLFTMYQLIKIERGYEETPQPAPIVFPKVSKKQEKEERKVVEEFEDNTFFK